MDWELVDCYASHSSLFLHAVCRKTFRRLGIYDFPHCMQHAIDCSWSELIFLTLGHILWIIWVGWGGGGGGTCVYNSSLCLSQVLISVCLNSVYCLNMRGSVARPWIIHTLSVHPGCFITQLVFIALNMYQERFPRKAGLLPNNDLILIVVLKSCGISGLFFFFFFYLITRG